MKMHRLYGSGKHLEGVNSENRYPYGRCTVSVRISHQRRTISGLGGSEVCSAQLASGRVLGAWPLAYKLQDFEQWTAQQVPVIPVVSGCLRTRSKEIARQHEANKTANFLEIWCN